MIIHIKYQGSLHVVVQINANVKIVGCLCLQGHNFNNLLEVHWKMLYIKDLDLEVSDKLCVYVFPIIL